MKKEVIFDSQKFSLEDIERMLAELRRKHRLSFEKLREKVRFNQKLETDETIDDIMLWRALEIAKREEHKFASLVKEPKAKYSLKSRQKHF